MQILKFTLAIFMVHSLSLSFAQSNEFEVCGTHEVDPWFEHYMSNLDQFQFDRPEEPVYIPLTVHILGTDDGQGYFSKNQTFDAICRLNEDYAPSNMQFFLKGDLNYIDNTTWYDHEDYDDGYDMMNFNNVDGTVNCYIVRNPAGNCGYYAPSGNAVALNKGCMSPNDHTWAHELGHFFSLPHTFNGWEGITYDPNTPTSQYQSRIRRGIENVQRTNCSSAADRFCETPADYLSYRWPCDANGESIVEMTDLNGVKFRADGTLFMSYANDNCSSRFSTDQIDAMYANLNTRRRTLLNNESFEGHVTEMPQMVSPQDGDAVQFDGGELSWTKVENATYYYVQVSRLPNLGGLLIVDDIVTDTTIALPMLDIGRTYYWRVRAFNRFDFCSNLTSRSSFKAAAVTSSNDFINSDEISIYPNPVSPASNEIRIVHEGEDFENYEVVSMTGAKVIRGKLDATQTITGSNRLPNGSYLLLLERVSGSVVKKIIVE